MLCRKGMTLLEIIIVLVMIAVATVFVFPNFNTPTEHARAVTAQSNLLAIYSAQQNYNNNNNRYCLSGNGVCGSLASIDTDLSLNLEDDGSYTYSCSTPALPPAIPSCKAIRTTVNPLGLSMVLNAPIVLTGGANPSCTLAAGSCP